MKDLNKRRLYWRKDAGKSENTTGASSLILDYYSKQVTFSGSCSSLIQKSRIQFPCRYDLNIFSVEQMIETRFSPVILYSGRETHISLIESLAERYGLRSCTVGELVAFFVRYPLVRIFHNVVAPELAIRIDDVDCVAQVSVGFNGTLTFSLARKASLFKCTAFLLKEK